MIKRMSHTVIYVLNQEEALKFYRDKLGFEVRTDDSSQGGFRWLSVGPKDQPDFEMVLMEPTPGFMYDTDTAAQLRKLIEKGAMGSGIFETKDCQKAYENMKANGIEFIAPPTERFYGIEAVFRDNSGNWFSMTQRKA
ncbi:MAG: VOC family protein [Candidatus Zixiibacteriota bacterium]